MKIPKPRYTQYADKRWYITAAGYHISEVGFASKKEAVQWWRKNGTRIFNDFENACAEQDRLNHTL